MAITAMEKQPCAVRLPERTSVLPWWTPYVLAAVLTLLSLRGSGALAPVDTDAARHAMNGVFIHDLLASGRLLHPIEYGKEYYGRLPALSMPYHPPFFPGVEALFYFVFGVRLFSARLAVALAVGTCSLLLYRMVRTTHGSHELAFCVTASTFILWNAQLVATDVMLEYPALALAMAAISCAVVTERVYSMRMALWFALFASAGIWAKQHAVFAGAVPPLYFLFTGRWRLLFGKALVISSALLGAALYVLIRLSAPFQETGVSEVATSAEDVRWIFLNNLKYYVEGVLDLMWGISGLFALLVCAALLILIWKKGTQGLNLWLYLSWAIAILPVLLFVGSYSLRYFFFVMPAVMTISYVLIGRAAVILSGERTARWILAACVTVWCGAGLFFHPDFLRGPAEAAQLVVRKTPGRVVYFGDADGSFAFAVRVLDPAQQTIVVSGEKLPDGILNATLFDAFCQRYSIGWVVFENGVHRAKWADLAERPGSQLALVRTLPLVSSRSRWRHGSVSVYRFSGPVNPGAPLKIEIPRIGSEVEVSH